MRLIAIKEELDGLYAKYNRREFVHPDPLEFLYRYEDAADREVAALVASSLAYGRVAQILASVEDALGRLGASPSRFLADASRQELFDALEGFKHRFTAGDELAALLFGVGRVRRRFGSLERCFERGVNDGETVLHALSMFVVELTAAAGSPLGHLLPSPARGSACKRLNLFLRWMVRQDDVDPGGWTTVPAAKLVVPLDTHMHRVGLGLGLTERKRADLRAAVEITAAFRTIAPDDPVRYDFALTRLGIRSDEDLGVFLEQLAQGGVERHA